MAAGSVLPDDMQGAPPQLGTPAPAAPSAPAPGGIDPNDTQGVPPGPPSMLQQSQQPDPGAAGVENPPGKKQLDTGKPPEPKYDQTKLEKANTTLDILNAMKPKSRTSYMDWWQQQHGDIDQKYDALQKDLGKRPDDQQPYSKKEKFAALLEFGLHLMANSRAGVQDQGHVLTQQLGDSMGTMQANHQAGIQNQQQQYDTQANAIEQGRASAQKGIGTPADAMKQQEKEDKDQTSELKDTAGAFKSVNDTLTDKQSALGAPTYSTAPDGTIQSITRQPDGSAKATPVLGIDGKPYKGRVLGRTSGSGIEKGDTAQIRNQKYLSEVLGLDTDTATKIAFKPKTGNASADHKDVYKAVLTATGSTDKAQRAANQYTVDNYGAHGLQQANGKIVRDPPPSQAVADLKPGNSRKFANGEVWAKGVDGKLRYISGGDGPQTLH